MRNADAGSLEGDLSRTVPTPWARELPHVSSTLSAYEIGIYARGVPGFLQCLSPVRPQPGGQAIGVREDDLLIGVHHVETDRTALDRHGEFDLAPKTKHQSGVAPGVDLGSRRHPGRPTSRSTSSLVDGPA